MDVSHCNPCCCISLKAGASISAGVDMVYSLGYIVRVYCLHWMVTEYPLYYPQIPTYYKSETIKVLFTFGSYAIAATSSLLLLIAILALPLRVHPFTCYVWLSSRLFIFFLHVFHAHHLLISYIPLFVNFGYEVVSTLFLHAYLAFVVFNFSKDAHDENIAKRKIAAAAEEEDPTPQHQKGESTNQKSTPLTTLENMKKKVPPSAMETSLFLAKRKAKFTHHRSSLDDITNVLYENSNPTLFISILSMKKDNEGGDDDDQDELNNIEDEFPIGDDDDSSWDDVCSTHSFFARFATTRKITNASLDSRINSETALIDTGMDNVVSSQFQNYDSRGGGSLSVFGDSSNILSQLLLNNKAKSTTKSNHSNVNYRGNK